jgi:aryl-alcohol dehydrogenase-like predicted oxidoreductase
VLGQALADLPRDGIVVSTKSRILDADGQRISSDAVIGNLEHSLRRLRTDHIDVYFLHAVPVTHYDYALHELVPALIEQQRRGKIRIWASVKPRRAILTRPCCDGHSMTPAGTS